MFAVCTLDIVNINVFPRTVVVIILIVSVLIELKANVLVVLVF